MTTNQFMHQSYVEVIQALGLPAINFNSGHTNHSRAAGTVFYYLVCMHGIPADVVAEYFSVNTNRVYRLCHKLRKRIREEREKYYKL